MEKKGQPGKGAGAANSSDQKNPKTSSGGGNPGDISRQEGGHAGYSSDEEQKQVNRENEKMHNERDEKDLDTSREEKVKTNEKTIIPGKKGNDDYQRNRE